MQFRVRTLDLPTETGRTRPERGGRQATVAARSGRRGPEGGKQVDLWCSKGLQRVKAGVKAEDGRDG
jgi:hypothetical protein